MFPRDIGAQIEPKVALHTDDWDGASALKGSGIDRVPDAQQKYDSALWVFILDDGAADEDVDFLIEHGETDTDGDYSTLKDVGKLTYDQSAGGGIVKTVKTDFETAQKYVRAKAQDEGSSDTDVGNADLTVTVICILGGLHQMPNS